MCRHYWLDTKLPLSHQRHHIVSFTFSAITFQHLKRLIHQIHFFIVLLSIDDITEVWQQFKCLKVILCTVRTVLQQPYNNPHSNLLQSTQRIFWACFPFSAPDLGSKQEMILDPFLFSWHTWSECIFKTYWLCPRPREGLQTSSCPGISAKCCVKSLEDLKRVKLWGSGVGPTSISYFCWWPGVEGESQLNIVSSFQGAQGAVSCVDVCPPLAMHAVSSPSVLLLAESILLWLLLAHLPQKNSCGPPQHH